MGWTNLKPNNEWEKLVRSLDTVRGDAMISFRQGCPFDHNPFEVGSDRHKAWAEGWEMGKQKWGAAHGNDRKV